MGKARRLNVTALFEATPALKQLASIVDRVTYMGSCELLLSPPEVSLVQDLVWANVERPEDAVLNTLLERQIGSLEASRWKPHVRLIVARLLLDANALYRADVNPVRKARVLLGWLEFKYHAGMDEEGDRQLGPVADVADEIESLLTREVSFSVLRQSNTLKRSIIEVDGRQRPRRVRFSIQGLGSSLVRVTRSPQGRHKPDHPSCSTLRTCQFDTEGTT